MKLEVGKTYVNRIGEKVTITDYTPGLVYPFFDSRGQSYIEEGRLWRHSKSIEDLVKEESTMKLELDTAYKDTNGDIFTIVEKDDDTKLMYRGESADQYWWYNEDGTSSNHVAPLVEKVTLKLEVGKSYKDWKGTVYKIAKKSGAKLPFRGESGTSKYWFNEDGTSREGVFPLIEEVTAVTEEVTSSTTFDPTKLVTTRDDRPARIVAHEPSLAPQETILAVVSGKLMTYHKDGCYYRDEKSDNDLINVEQETVTIRGVKYIVTLDPLSIRKA